MGKSSDDLANLEKELCTCFKCGGILRITGIFSGLHSGTVKFSCSQCDYAESSFCDDVSDYKLLWEYQGKKNRNISKKLSYDAPWSL